MNSTDRLGPGPSVRLSHPSQPQVGRGDPSQKRTLEVAASRIRTTSTPRDRRVESAFPISDFQQAVLKFDFPKIKQLLKAAGVSNHDVNFIEQRTKLICGNEIALDPLLDVLLTTAIERSFLTYLPGLPNYTVIDMKKINAMAKMATNQFCTKMNQGSFDVFCAFLNKYRPTNKETCLRQIYPLISEDPLFGPRMKRSFPEFDFQASKMDDDDAKVESSSSSAKPVNDFDFFQFRMALINLFSDQFCHILVGQGWTEEALETTKRYMDQLHSERSRWGRPDLECPQLECLDDITYHLIMAGIDHRMESLLRFIHILPRFKGFNGDVYNKNLALYITSQLCQNPDNPFLFQLFVTIMNQFQPQNRGEYIESAMSKVSRENQQKLAKTFPKI